MSSLSRDVTSVRALAPAERRLLIEATIWLGLVRVATAVLPYRRVASLLRLTQSDPSRVSPALTIGREADEDRRDAEAIRWAVQVAAARTSALSTCLVQSLAGHLMLRRHTVPSVVYLGVGKDADGEFIAHSWLRCSDRIVTGGGSHQRYSVIAAYQPAPGKRG